MTIAALNTFTTKSCQGSTVQAGVASSQNCSPPLPQAKTLIQSCHFLQISNLSSCGKSVMPIAKSASLLHRSRLVK